MKQLRPLTAPILNKAAVTTAALALTSALLQPVAQAEESLGTVLIESETIEEGGVPDSVRSNSAEGSVSTSAKQIEDSQATSLEDALKDNASIEIDQVNGAQGSLIYIRGETGSAVSVRVEGAPQNRTLISHSGANDANAYWVNTDMFETITVLPGAAANTYGNGSTGGVVLLETKDPESIIRPGRDWGANLRYTHESNGAANHLSTDVARQFNDKVAANLTLSRVKTDPYEDADGTRYPSTGSDDLSYLAKAVITPTPDHRAELSVLNNLKDYSRYTEATTDGVTTVTETRYDVMDRTLSANYRWHPQDSDLLNLSVRASRNTIDSDSKVDTASVWSEAGSVQTDYLEISNSMTLPQGEWIIHNVSLGADRTHDDVNLTYTNPDGSLNHAGRTLMGAWISDNLLIGDTLELSASARYDSFDIARDYTGVVESGTASTSVKGESAISPKISVIWRPFEQTSLQGLGIIALVGSGFRAPTIVEMYGKNQSGIFTGTDEDGDGVYESDTSAGCLDGHGSACVLPNENLKGETSVSRELGLTYNRKNLFATDDNLSARINYVHSDIDDRITTVTLGTLDESVSTPTAGGVHSVTQYQNLEGSAVYGWEASLSYDSETLFGKAGYQNMKGYYTDVDGVKTDLTDVSPATLNLGIGSYFNQRKGQIGLDMSSRERMRYSAVSRSVTYNYEKEAYRVFDLYGAYQLSQQLKLQARIENLTNSQYTKNTLTTNTSTGVTSGDYYAGRNIKLSASYQF